MPEESKQQAQPQTPEKPLEVRGLTEADYLRWRHHPVTKWFLEYLRDFRSDLATHAQEQWLGGEIELATEKELKGRINTLDEMATLEFSEIAAFYEQVDTMNREDDEVDQSVSEDDAK